MTDVMDMRLDLAGDHMAAYQARLEAALEAARAAAMDLAVSEPYWCDDTMSLKVDFVPAPPRTTLPASRRWSVFHYVKPDVATLNIAGKAVV